MGLEDIMSEFAKNKKEETIEDKSVETQEQEKQVETKAVEQKSEAVTYDFSKFGVTNFEELEQRFVEKETAIKTYEQTVAERMAAEQELKAQLEQAKQDIEKAASYEDLDMARLAYLKKNDPDKFKTYAKLVTGDKLDPLEVVKGNLKGSLEGLTDDEVEKYVLKEYGLNIQAPDENDEDAVEQYQLDVKIGRAKLQSEAKKIQERMLSEFNSITVPTKTVVSDEQIAIEKAQAKQSWTPYVETLADFVSNSEYKIKDGENEVVIPVKATPEFKKEVAKVISDFVYENKIAHSQENLAQVGRLAREYVIRQNEQQIVNATWEAAKKYYDSQLAALKGQKGMKEISNSGKTGLDAYTEMIKNIQSRT